MRDSFWFGAGPYLWIITILSQGDPSSVQLDAIGKHMFSFHGKLIGWRRKWTQSRTCWTLCGIPSVLEVRHWCCSLRRSLLQSQRQRRGGAVSVNKDTGARRVYMIYYIYIYIYIYKCIPSTPYGDRDEGWMFRIFVVLAPHHQDWWCLGLLLFRNSVV